ncbi:MAG TPA: hypothetical protein DDW52_27130 [Planctomycetaceae bacterium]|nr:hypothetical protein [Planctomycetaceae bacterium]
MSSIETPADTDVCDEMFGSVHLGDCEFAIKAKYIKQVVQLPASMVKVPLSPDFIRGTFNLRDTAITVIDLAMLFGESTTESEHDKVAILEQNGLLIGVLIGGTGKVFKGIREEFSEFNPETRGPYVSGVFRSPKDDKLVQVIDVRGLFQKSGVYTDVSCRQGRKDHTTAKRHISSSRHIMFSLGHRRFALPLAEVQEVFQLETVTTSIFSVSPSCIGTTELRGCSLPLFDLMSLTGEHAQAADESSCTNKHVVAMQSNSVLLGIVVDSIDDIFLAYDDEIVSFPPADLIGLDTYIGSLVRDSQNVLVINQESLLAHDEIVEVATAHAKLSVAPLRRRSKVENKESVVQQTYLTFNAGTKYAVLLNDVLEIIDLPRRLLEPPGLGKQFLGVHNLRRRSNIAIAEMPHELSHSTTRPDKTDRKVLIFSSGNASAGLAVDAVDSIVSVSSSDRIAMDAHSNHSGSIDSREMLRVKDQQGHGSLIPILDLPTVFDNVSTYDEPTKAPSTDEEPNSTNP